MMTGRRLFKRADLLAYISIPFFWPDLLILTFQILNRNPYSKIKLFLNRIKNKIFLIILTS